MHFLALISGGKDSFYNIHHCLEQGHTLVALANLHPAAPEQDEIDSFMFQTVGHEVINHYSECLDVPLYRQAIVGKSSNQELEYSVTQDDEIEDLYVLIKRVVEKHPEIEGVSCGAILSHYQRTRVENVCSRLGLTSLTYLWQRTQHELMSEMCQSGLVAVLVKVAAIGLGAQDLGKSLVQMLPKLERLNSMYDVHVCGEGGEFESLVLDAPFFKKRLEIVDQQVVKIDSEVSYLRLNVKVVEKSDSEKQNLVVPEILDDEFHQVLTNLDKIQQMKETENTSVPQKTSTNTFESPSTLYITNVTSDDISDVFVQLTAILQTHSLSYNDIQHVTLLLSDMSKFEAVNSVYEQHFRDFYLPPSRVCIQTNVEGISLSCVVAKCQTNKQGIHIRSRSYWAPQNIGPYSQAIVRVHPNYKVASLSGQIPLIPSTMKLADKGPEFDSVLSLQHLFRAKKLVGVNNFAYTICFVTDPSIVPVVCQTWEEVGGKALVIARVEMLPKGALVEWAGLSYEEIHDMYADQEENVEGPEGTIAFGPVSVTTVFEPREMEGYNMVLAKNWNGAGDYIPVLDLWDQKGNRVECAIINIAER